VTLDPPVERGEEPDRKAGGRELLVSWLRQAIDGATGE
jgi:hypothetical protein